MAGCHPKDRRANRGSSRSAIDDDLSAGDKGSFVRRQVQRGLHNRRVICRNLSAGDFLFDTVVLAGDTGTRQNRRSYLGDFEMKDRDEFEEG